jgi:hypothetical protein
MPTVEVLVDNERSPREACRDFKLHLDVATTFDGEGALEIESDHTHIMT